eukprot:7751073-Pyramimonas_sp.AAC.1
MIEGIEIGSNRTGGIQTSPARGRTASPPGEPPAKRAWPQAEGALRGPAPGQAAAAGGDER